MRPRLLALCLAALLAVVGVAGSTAGPDVVAGPAGGCTGQVIDHGSVRSDAADPIEVTYTSFRPEVVPARTPLPVILHSHAWGGRRFTSGFEAWNEACFLVVSFDQRGHGQAGGQPFFQDPDLEARDVLSLVDHIATWPDVLLDGPGDPVLGAIGTSYGGGFQWISALAEVRSTGATRFDALAPEIAWYDLPESLAPNDVVRTTWNAVLYAYGAEVVPEHMRDGFAWVTASGEWANGTVQGQPAPVPDLDRPFHANSPAAFVDPDPAVRTRPERVQLDIPVLIRQGTTDNLFNLNQGIKNFLRTITDDARARSTLVAYNGGHNLPSVAPLGSPYDQGSGIRSEDRCSGPRESWDEVRIRFFQGALGLAELDPADVYGRGSNVVGTTVDGTCIAVAGLGASEDATQADLLGDLARAYQALPTSAPFAVGAGAPVHLPLRPRAGARDLDQTVTLFGTPRLLVTASPLGLDQRLFFGLAKGLTPADATVIQNNLVPVRWLSPATVGVDGTTMLVDLPAVVAQLAPGEQLFLTVTPVADGFVAHASQRTPGTILLHSLDVFLPFAEVVG